MNFLYPNFHRFNRMPLRRKVLVGLVVFIAVLLLQGLGGRLFQSAAFDEVQVGMSLPQVHQRMGGPRWVERVRSDMLSGLDRPYECGSGHSCVPQWALKFDYPVPLTLDTKVLVVYFNQDFIVIEKSVHHSP